jgi:hypothetical protein
MNRVLDNAFTYPVARFWTLFSPIGPTIISLLVLNFAITSAEAADDGDTIKHFGSTVTLDSQGNVQVDEQIQVDFGKNKHHGLIREIPSASEFQGEIRRHQVHVDATSCDNLAVQYRTNIAHDSLRVSIGDANKFVSGIHLYEIKYTYSSATVLLADNRTQLKWNVTGNKWKMPIQQADCQLFVPAGTDRAQVVASGYEMKNGAEQSREVGGSKNAFQITGGDLAPSQELVIKVALPPSVVNISSNQPAVELKPPNPILHSLGTFVQGGGLLLLLVIGIIGFVLWKIERLLGGKSGRATGYYDDGVNNWDDRNNYSSGSGFGFSSNDNSSSSSSSDSSSSSSSDSGSGGGGGDSW